MNVRYLFLMTTLVFLGFSVSAVAKKCPEPGHPSCGGDDPPSDTEINLYKVTSDPGLVSGVNWMDGAQKGSIDYKETYEGSGEINLSYFIKEGGPFGSAGSLCFPIDNVKLRFGGFGKYRGSLASGGFWFTGKTFESKRNDDVAYTFEVFGTFVDRENWPLAIGESSILEMTAWEMTTRNEWEIHNISCTGGGDTDSNFPVTKITITRTQ